MPFLTHNGHRLFYREVGAGPLLVILPGNTASSVYHADELAYFGQRFHAVALDFWGTGQSDRLDVWPTDWFDQAAHDTAALIRELSTEPAVAVGTSGGAAVALLVAALHPEQVRAVIADSGQARWPAEWSASMLAERGQRAPGQIAFWQGAHGDDWEQVVAADTDMLLRLVAQRPNFLTNHFPHIKAPVLITATVDDDLVYDIQGQSPAMVAQIPNSHLFMTKGGGHPLMWTRPEVFRTAVDCFLAHL